MVSSDFDPDLAYYRLKARRTGKSWKTIDMPAPSAQDAIDSVKARGFDEVVAVSDDFDRVFAPLVRRGELHLPLSRKVAYFVHVTQLPRFVLWMILLLGGCALLWSYTPAALICIAGAIAVGLWSRRYPAPAIRLQSALKAYEKSRWGEVAAHAGACFEMTKRWGWEGCSAGATLRVSMLARMQEFEEAERFIAAIEDIPDCRPVCTSWLRCIVLESQNQVQASDSELNRMRSLDSTCTAGWLLGASTAAMGLDDPVKARTLLNQVGGRPIGTINRWRWCFTEGLVLLAEGKGAEAERALAESLQAAADYPHKPLRHEIVATVQASLSLALGLQGRLKEGNELFELSRPVMESSGLRFLLTRCRAMYAPHEAPPTTLEPSHPPISL